MRQITIQVPDQQYDFFMQLVRNLKFVKVKREFLLRVDGWDFKSETTLRKIFGRAK